VTDGHPPSHRERPWADAPNRDRRLRPFRHRVDLGIHRDKGRLRDDLDRRRLSFARTGRDEDIDQVIVDHDRSHVRRPAPCARRRLEHPVVDQDIPPDAFDPGRPDDAGELVEPGERVAWDERAAVTSTRIDVIIIFE
jgi:hypothetical protein